MTIVVDPPAHTAFEIEARLLRPGPMYLLASFAQPMFLREPELSQAARWFGLEEALLQAGVDPHAGETSDQWLSLVRWCASTLIGSSGEYVEALAEALGQARKNADATGKPTQMSVVWHHMSEVLRGAELQRDEDKDGFDPETLRGRKWASVRQQIATALETLIGAFGQVNLLPRNRQLPSTFDGTNHYERIHAQLRGRLSGGLAVIAAPPGSGKSELALSYAAAKSDLYDHIFWIRADDSFRLVTDFLEMARRLLRRDGEPSALIHDALGELRTSGRWLLVFDAVAEPWMLLPYLPRHSPGHVLCTYSVAEDDEGGITDAEAAKWAPLLNVNIGRDGLLEPMDDGQARAFVAEATGRSEAEVAGIASAVKSSRLAAALASNWINLHVPDIAKFETDWRTARPQLDSRRGQDAAMRAALLLMEAMQERPRDERDPAAVEMLLRLYPFGDGAVPAVALDDERFQNLSKPFDDQRLARLVELGLATRADLFTHVKYFEVNTAVRRAVEILEKKRSDEDSRQDRAHAARTILYWMQRQTYARVPEPTSDFLPHAESVAKRELESHRRSPPVRPHVALELLALSALGQLMLGRVRAADHNLHLLQRACDDQPEVVRAALVRNRDDWAGIPPHRAISFDPPMTRLWKLISSLRLAGFPEVAVRVFNAVEPLCPSRGRIAQETAHVMFEGALALRDLDVSELSAAEKAVDRAAKLWKDNDPAWYAAALSFQGVIALDRGDIVTAASTTRGAAERRERLLRDARAEFDRLVVSEAPDHELRTARDVLTEAYQQQARGLHLRGRIAYYQGSLQVAREEFLAAVLAWDEAASATADDRAASYKWEINRISARSNLALVDALLGEQAAAEDEARRTRREAERIHAREHRNLTVILSNTAQVLRIGGHISEARALHVQALEMSERVWGPDHRITFGLRRVCAETLLDAGSPQAAFAQLHRVLDSYRANENSGTVLARARAWTILSRLLVENSLFLGDPRMASDLRLLNLGERAAAHAQQLFQRAAPGTDQWHPEFLTTLTVLADIAIRRREADAVELASRAHGLARDQRPVHALSTLARVTRARAVLLAPLRGASEQDPTDGDDGTLIDAQTQIDERLKANSPTTAAHNLEMALAVMSVDLALAPAQMTKAEKNAMYKDAHARIKHFVIDPLRRHIASGPHQVHARAYAELAVLASRLGLERERARSERERDRHRPVLVDGEFELVVDRLLVAEAASLPRAA